MINSLILLLLSSLLSVEYGAETWALDPTNSSIQFNVSHLLISTVPGTFNDFEVQIHPQKENSFDQTKLEAVIKVESIDTGNKQRDSHLLESDFFDSAVYPNITFQNALLVFSDKTSDSLLAKRPGLHFKIWEHEIIKPDLSQEISNKSINSDVV